MSDPRDELFAAVAIEQDYVTEAQLAEAHRAQEAAVALGMELPLSDVFISKKLLTKEKTEEIMRVVKVRSGDAHMVGEYQVLSKLGEGGMGVVYKAKHTETGQIVALKVLPPSLARNPTTLKRFVREAEITRELEHKNIVRCINLGFDKERKMHYFAMEYIEGEDLSKCLAKQRRIPEAKAIDIVRQIALALEHAESKGLVHRDIKPQNIMLTPDGPAKLLDLGLARNIETQDTRLTQSGLFAGSPHYASPEQARGTRETDIRGDIYSLGATFYHMLTGKTPFSGDNAAAVLTQVVSGQLPWPSEICSDVSEGTSRVVEKMMAKDVGGRYQALRELINHLDLVAEGRPIPRDQVLNGKSAVVRMAEARPRARKSGKDPAPGGSKVAYAVVGGLAVLLIAAGAALFSGNDGLPAGAEKTPPLVPSPPPVVAQAEDHSTGVASDDRRLEEMAEFAEQYVKDHPKAFERAIVNFTKLQREGRGSRFELVADSRLEEIRAAWKKTALEALALLEKTARALADEGNIDGALAALDTVPEDLVAPIRSIIEDKKSEAIAAAENEIRSTVSRIEKALADGDLDGAKDAYADLERVRFERNRGTLLAELKKSDAKIRDAQQVSESAVSAKAAEMLPVMLDGFDQLLRAGSLGEARQLAEAAARDETLTSIARKMKAAASVAAALEERKTCMLQGAAELKGTTASLMTIKGLRKGEVLEADESGIKLATKIIINGRVAGTTKFDLKWSELAVREQSNLAKSWKNETPDANIARAYIAVFQDDPDEAQAALDLAKGHALAARIRQAIESLRLGEEEAAAHAAWRTIERKGRASKLNEREANELVSLIDEFQKTHGATKCAASVVQDISRLTALAGDAGVTWVNVPLQQLDVTVHGRASKAIKGGALALTVPRGPLSGAKVVFLRGVCDSRLKFEFAGPSIELELRRSVWRGAVTIAIDQRSIDIVTYPDENKNSPERLVAQQLAPVPATAWRSVDIALRGKSFVLRLDGKEIVSTESLPRLAAGESSLLVRQTPGTDLLLRNVQYAVLDKTSGTVAGILTNKQQGWIEIKGDEEGFVRRYAALDESGRQIPGLVATIVSTITTNRVSAVWKFVGGQRLVSAMTVLVPEATSGKTTGIVIEKDAKNVWIDVEPEGAPPDRYLPKWLGGMPADGGGPEKRVIVAMSQVREGDNVEVEWIYNDRKRLIDVTVLSRKRAGPAPRIQPGVKFHDGFENGVGNWKFVKLTPNVVGEASIESGAGLAKAGRSSLAMKCKLAPLAIPIMIRPAANINRLSFWARTMLKPIDFIVFAQERGDESRYETSVHLDPADGWKHLDLSLSTFNLAGDAKDENAQLDFDHIQNIGIIDIGGIMMQSGDSTLLLDEVVGEFKLE